mgnify:CR=1 FL=1
MNNTNITRNYHAHGGSEWVVGGKLTFLPGATVEGAEGLFDLPSASTPCSRPCALPASWPPPAKAKTPDHGRHGRRSQGAPAHPAR